MSWQAAVAVGLALALAAGFAWYERSHPPAKLVALVATLAALAVLGRLAFAPLPNVKPTTDIVLFAGYALGGAPGFVVGATTAVASNFFFGQGPWTPWQMLAWGLVGLFGAGLGRVTGRRLGRLPLAFSCACAGLGFGLIMNLSTYVTYTEPGVARGFLAISASAAPFDLAHALGNFLFALALGPLFVRTLERFRRRFEVQWRPPALGRPAASTLARSGGTAAALALALLVVVVPAAAARPSHQVRAAVSYLDRAQNRDGGFGAAARSSSSQLFTGWAGLGLAAARVNPRDVTRAGHSVVDFTRSKAGRIDDTGELERTILMLRSAGLNPRHFAGRNLMAELRRRQGSNGSFRGQVNWTAFGVLALRSAGSGPRAGRVRSAGRFITGQQNSDGGFAFGGKGGASDVDDTGAVLQALGAAGKRHSGATARAVAYLKRAQNRDGGLGQLRSSPSNAQSTAWAVQGLVAAGRSPARLRRSGHSPLSYLASLQEDSGAERGSFRYSRTSRQTPVWVTAQVVPALLRRPFPLAPVRRHTGRSGAASSAVPALPGTGSGGSAGASGGGAAPRGAIPAAGPGLSGLTPFSTAAIVAGWAAALLV